MICPICGYAGDPHHAVPSGVLSIVVCPNCGLTCKHDALGVTTQAKIEDLRLLTDDQLKELRHKRAPLVPRRQR